MMRPGPGARPFANGNGNGNGDPCVFPIDPGALAAIAGAIAGGVKVVWYADRRVEFMSLADLIKAYNWLAGQLGCLSGPVRRGACFSKGLDTGYGPWGWAAVEHGELPGVDVLFSRGAPVDPLRTDDVDWERGR